MRKLSIPAPLKQEFATVEAIWNSNASTRRVDALLLSWIKYEKQLRRLFCFLVFQHSKISENELDEFIDVLVENRYLYPDKLMIGIDALGVASVSELLSPRYAELYDAVAQIKPYRNKLMHGQITGLNIQSPRLVRDVLGIVDWISCLADASEKTFGYDGLKRNTYKIAKATSKIAVRKYPFNTAKEFKEWLETTIIAEPKISRL